MKAIVQDRYGPADVLELREIDIPVPGDGEMRVRVGAAGVDPGVWHLMTGLPYLVRAAYGLRKPKVPVRGWDFAGTVETLGAGVTEFRAGDEVFGTCDGSLAEYALVRADRAVPKPASLTLEQAAAVPTSGVTAVQALRDKGGTTPGQSVLIIGAAGGVGTFAVQVAKALGADVTGVCSTSKVDLVRSLGADGVIDYTREDLASTGRRYDVVVNVAGLRSLSSLRSLLTPRGTLVIVGGEGEGRVLGGSGRTLAAVALSPLVKQRLRGLFAVPRKKDIAFLAELIDAGKVTPIIDRTYSLGETPDAVRHIRQGHTRGKLVVRM